jgi:hypothetical protein
MLKPVKKLDPATLKKLFDEGLLLRREIEKRALRMTRRRLQTCKECRDNLEFI